MDFSLPLNSTKRHFMQIFNETLDNIAPLEESRERKTANPLGLLKDLKKLTSKRNQADIECLRTGKNESFCKFKQLRKRVQSGVRLSKSQGLRRQFKNCVGDSKQTYKFLVSIDQVLML